jgi:hypothetical protein
LDGGEFGGAANPGLFGFVLNRYDQDVPSITKNAAYVSSALSLTAFIGDLYSHGLIPASQVRICLSVLVEVAECIEHVHAIHLLLVHAGPRMWMAQDAGEFMDDLGRRMRRDGDGDQDRAEEVRSMLGTPVLVGSTSVRLWLEEMRRMVLYWPDAGGVPSWLAAGPPYNKRHSEHRVSLQLRDFRGAFVLDAAIYQRTLISVRVVHSNR